MAGDSTEVEAWAAELWVRDDPADEPMLLDALHDSREERRWGAVYALSSASRTHRAVIALMGVLLNRAETPLVRGQAAECLGMLGKSRATKALIRASRDPSPDVRFWCVFGLGQLNACSRRRLGRAGIRALEARLDDWAKPEGSNYWPIRFEALAILQGLSESTAAVFQQELQRVLDDPIANAELWPWAQCYTDEVVEAVAKIAAAGLDPVTLGRTPVAQR